ncbi:MAG: nucleotidyltransferase domain-containing protein [Anaerolineae bacterium]|nr:nucleotidyltransferase domain-containing protein [Anaerolineae bacterium]
MFEQDRFVVRLQQRVMREADIQVCCLSGSFGRNTADPYSDVDIVLVFDSDEARERAWANRRDFTHSVLAYVPAKSFDAAHIRPYFHIVLFSNGTKADFRYETPASLQPNGWDSELKILKDTSNWAAGFLQAAAGMGKTQPVISGRDLTALDERFWVMFWDVYRQVRRGDTVKPFGEYLNLLAATLPTLMQLLPPDDAAHRELVNLRYTLEADATLEHMRRLLSAYQLARTAVVNRYRIAYIADGAFERSVERAMAK